MSICYWNMLLHWAPAARNFAIRERPLLRSCEFIIYHTTNSPFFITRAFGKRVTVIGNFPFDVLNYDGIKGAPTALARYALPGQVARRKRAPNGSARTFTFRGLISIYWLPARKVGSLFIGPRKPHWGWLAARGRLRAGSYLVLSKSKSKELIICYH